MYDQRPKIGISIVLTVSCMAGCTVGPRYRRPPVATPPAFRELTPKDYQTTDGWKEAQPKDDTLRGNWWEIFGDPNLNALEDRVNISNQNIVAAMQSFFAARAMVKEARAQLFPTASTSPAISYTHASSNLGRGAVSTSVSGSGNTAAAGGGGTFADYAFPFDATWQPDLFGRIRNTVKAAAYGAQASAADLANIRLTAQGDLATDYFELRGQDALKQLLHSTVEAYQKTLDLTRGLYETGIDQEEDVAQADTQLKTAQAQETAVEIQRAQYEHAIALLTGQPASTFSFPREPLNSKPPAIPFGVPSQLLERRPDIAAAERSMAQANAQIGIARAAYFPTVTLSASGGVESSSFLSWFSWPSRFFSVGPSAVETIFDAGLRRATVEQYRAQYLEAVATYRETVLTAFQQVEDSLAALRILSQELQQEDEAVEAARRYLNLATSRYQLGLDPYLNVLTAQNALLANQQTAVNLQIQQMTSSSALIEALGGGWNDTQIPTPRQLVRP